MFKLRMLFLKMNIIFVFIVVFELAHAELSDVYCCKDGDVDENENVCYNAVENTTTSFNINCTNSAHIADIELYNMQVENNTLIIRFDTIEVVVGSGNFCIANSTLTSNETYYAVCPDEEDEFQRNVLGYCLVVSVIFLALTIFVYALLPEVRDLQGKSIVNFCTSLAIGLGILSIMKIMDYEDMTFCAIRGFLAYFFILATIFWTNAISIQILCSLRQPFVTNYGWKPFIWYALYAWGVPALLTICMAIVNFHPGNHQKPGIGLNHCWFYDTTQQWYYMFSVTSILIIVNICIFVYISNNIWRHSFKSSHLKALRYKFWMTVKMSLIMGIPWIFEMISSLSPPHVIWGIIDVLNGLQGPLIFLALVVFRRRVIKALYKRGYLDCISGMVEKHLAVADDEEDIVEHTTEVPLH